MIPNLVFEELAIAISAENHNHTLLTPDFLLSAGIVPEDWELAKPPVLDSQMARVRFTNDTIISSEFDNITFSQTLEAKPLESVQILTLAQKYIAALPIADYQEIAINPSCFFTFENEGEAAVSHYILTALLSPQKWHELSNQPVRATLNLAYTLDKGEFNLKIDDIQMQRPNKTSQSAVLFSGNFPYEIIGDTPSQRLQHLYQLLDNWQENLKTFRELINQRFFL
jgi:hypothetical protein